MSFDNEIRAINQRISRLAKFAGRGKSALNAIAQRIQSIVNPQNIYNFYKDKYEKENPPKTADEIQSLYRRADKYAREQASIKVFEMRKFPDGTTMPYIYRKSALADFLHTVSSQLLNQIPTTGQVKAQAVNAGLPPTAESINKLYSTLADFSQLMEMYRLMTNINAYKDIKEIRQLAKDEKRRPSYAEMDRMIAIYNGS